MELKEKIINLKTLPTIFGILAMIGFLIFGIPSSDSRPKIYELYLAGIWFLMTLSAFPSFFEWKKTHWSRRLFAIIAPIFVILYLIKYFS